MSREQAPSNPDGGDADGDSARVDGGFQFRQLFPADDSAYGGHVEAEKHGEQRGLVGSLDDLTLGGNVDG